MEERFTIPGPRIGALVIVLSMAAAGLWADDAATSDSSWEALINEVLQSSPALEAARLKWEAMQERPEIAKALPDPMLTYGYFLQNVETRVGAMNQKLTIAQKVPLFGKRGLAASRAEKEALVAMWEYQKLGRELILRARLASIDLHRIDRSREILQAQLDLLATVGATAQARYEAGRTPQTDVLKVRLAVTEIQNRLLALAQQRDSALARLNALRDAPPATPFQPAVELPAYPLPDQSAALAAGTRYRQELQSAGVAIERDEFAVELARKNRLPDFTFGLDYTQVDRSTVSNPSDNGQDALMAFVGINLPIWRGKLRAEEREAQKKLAASRAARRDTARTVEADITEAWSRAEVARDQLTLYDESLLPAAQQTFEVSHAGYEAGKAGFIDLLDSERMLLALQLGRLMSESERARALASLERAVGVDLDQIGRAPPDADGK
ncbi:MAG: TolC family protein [Opitutaceae bacterium]